MPSRVNPTNVERVPIYVTGHSLGGGLAHLFAVALMLRNPGALPLTLTRTTSKEIARLCISLDLIVT